MKEQSKLYNINKLSAYFIFFGIVLVFIFFRFYNLNQRLGFGWDQEQYSTQVWDLVKNHKPTLLGPRVVSDKGFFLAPYFTYLIAPFYLLTNLHPNAMFLFLIFVNILFLVCGIFIINRIFGLPQAVGFIALWSVNPLMAGYDVTSWWPVLVPVGIMFTIYLLYKLYQQNHPITWILLGLSLGFFSNMHFQFIFIDFFVFIFILLIYKQKKISINHVLLMIVCALITLTPLFIFDLRHDFLNLKLFINFFISRGVDNQKINMLAWTPVFSNFAQTITITKQAAWVWNLLFFILIGYGGYWLSNKMKGFGAIFNKTFVILWLIFPFVFTLYGRRPSEYYFIFLYPFIYLVIVNYLSTKKLYLLIIPLFFLLLIGNYSRLLNNLNTDALSLYHQDRAVRMLGEQTVGRKHNITFSVPLGRDSGFRYLLNYYQIKQTGNWNDTITEIKIPANEKCQIKSGMIGVQIND